MPAIITKKGEKGEPDQRIYASGGLCLEVRPYQDRLWMSWRGRSTSRVISDDLITFVEQWFSGGNEEMPWEVHCEHLEHANSQTVGFITGFIGRTFDRRAPATFFYDPNSNFQRVLFNALEPMLSDRAHVIFKTVDAQGEVRT